MIINDKDMYVVAENCCDNVFSIIGMPEYTKCFFGVSCRNNDRNQGLEYWLSYPMETGRACDCFDTFDELYNAHLFRGLSMKQLTSEGRVDMLEINACDEVEKLLIRYRKPEKLVIKTNSCNDSLSWLGFGTMRLPCHSSGEINYAEVEEMTGTAMKYGVNYFDTAYPYHGGRSEIVIGKCLSNYPRESYRLADKYPGHQIAQSYNPAEIFEDQLKKCGVDYFDYYLLHNVYENSIDVYLDPKWGIVDYFLEQKRLGRIRHLGFSAHGDIATMTRFLDAVGEHMEFCQIQLNWLDWTMQDAKGKVELLNERNIPIWVMEPLRGGTLCKLSEKNEARLKALRPDETIVSWSFRFLQSIKGITMVLSGMSDLRQMYDNVITFTDCKPLNEEEMAVLLDIAEEMKSAVPCTGCKYCVDSCPMELNIPKMMATYNELCFDAKTNPIMWLEALPEDKQPASCIGCGSCAAMCPQHIDIPTVMADLSRKFDSIPKWGDICREREEAAKRLKQQ